MHARRPELRLANVALCVVAKCTPECRIRGQEAWPCARGVLAQKRGTHELTLMERTQARGITP
eukprot:5677653-Amphidinium_carterae.1